MQRLKVLVACEESQRVCMAFRELGHEAYSCDVQEPSGGHPEWHVAIENPVGVMNTCYRKPDQIINPYEFAESVDDAENYVTKATCLWLKGLPLLVGTGLPKPDNEKLYGRNPSGKVSNWEERQIGGNDRAKNRSKTFSGIAKAIAEQYSKYILEVDYNEEP